ncbi:Bicdl1 [Phodopus roborovskii]|uniref:Bicdl1 protein n=1 Tax=Phodopus roborovskii TaxID=109678 RepID=A0AAU9YW06_PHORO|nr:Bicdl1 [Phodopus roborovskii]
MSAFCLGLAGRASAPAEPDSACCMELPAGAGDAVGSPAAAAALVSFPGGPGELELALEEELALLAAGERPSDPGEHPQAEPGSPAEGHGPPPPPPPPTQDPELLSVIRQKEKDLVLAARLGKALLERNQDMSRQYEQMHQELTDKLEHLEQEKHELRRRFENREGEWEGRVSELETDVKLLQDELERQQAHLREADREKTRAVQELSEQNQRLLDQLSRLRLQLWEAYCQVRYLCSHLRGNDSADSAVSTDSSMDESSETSSAKDVPAGSLRTALNDLKRLIQSVVDGVEPTVTLLSVEMTALKEERDRLRVTSEDKEPKEQLQRAIRDRDEAIAKKNAVELELAKCKMDMMSLNSQLLDAIQQKLNLSQQLEAWQDDMHRVIDRQLMDTHLKEQSRPAAAAFSRGHGVGRGQEPSTMDGKRLFSFFRKI